MKIVVNRCYGEFNLSDKGIKRYLEIKDVDFGIYEKDDYPHYIKCDITTPGPFNDIIFMRGAQKEELEYNDNDYISKYDLGMDDRTDPTLVQVVEELGSEASGRFVELIVIEIPDDVDWYIFNNGDIETIEEKHRSW